MSVLEALILGLIQGVTEFLPVSSSGHLTVLQNWMNINESILTFDIMVHTGSLLAIGIALREEWLLIWQGFSPKPEKAVGRRLFLLLLIASVPTGLVGVLLRDYIDMTFHQPLIPGFMLILTGAFLYWADKVSKTNRANLEEISAKQAFTMGIGQSLALLPGLSRSGTTMSFGLFSGIKKNDAAKFSFLMAAPAILGAALLECIKFFKDGAIVLEPKIAFVGMISSAISSYIAIRFFLGFLKKGRLKWFAYYVWVLGAIVVYVASRG